MVKKIIINNKEEYNNFLNKIFFYKYYKFTNFEVKSKIKSNDLDIIVKTLNIKNKKKRLTYLYDEIIKYLDAYYPKSICDFKNNQCFVQRKRNDNAKFGCCIKCHRVKPNIGCPTFNSSCKLLYCKPALEKIKKLKISDIPITRCLSIFQKFLLKFNFYSTREQIINDLRFGIIYWYIRNIPKSIKLSLNMKA